MGGTAGPVFDEDATPAGGLPQNIPQGTPLGWENTATTATDTAITAGKTSFDEATTDTASFTTVDVWAADEMELGSMAHLPESITPTDGTFWLGPVPLTDVPRYFLLYIKISHTF